LGSTRLYRFGGSSSSGEKTLGQSEFTFAVAAVLFLGSSVRPSAVDFSLEELKRLRKFGAD
jgi:hypothetical protein